LATSTIGSLVAANGRTSSTDSGAGSVDKLADLHQKTVDSTVYAGPKAGKSRSHEEVEDEKHGITEIGLERADNYGPSSAYTVFIKSDGTLHFKGDARGQKMSQRIGIVNKRDFTKLAQFVKDAGYMDLENTYERSVTDNPTVVMNANRKVIKNYANAGPTRLWAIEQLIDKLMLEARWDDEKKER
jgi:hypothetical protein